MNVIGLDACKMGWCGIGRMQDTIVSQCFSGLDEVISLYKNLDLILIDIPIGLSSGPFTRTVDAEARKQLQKRKASIFSPPCRQALYGNNYKEALQINKLVEGKGISIQAYNISKKIKEVDEWIDKNTDTFEIFEAHPELCFKSINANVDLMYSKHEKTGIEERKSLLFKTQPKLKRHFEKLLKNYLRKEVKPDDILDAMALLVVALESKKLKYIEDDNKIDATGKKVRIIYG